MIAFLIQYRRLCQTTKLSAFAAYETHKHSFMLIIVVVLMALLSRIML
jgi:hypothetical protein